MSPIQDNPVKVTNAGSGYYARGLMQSAVAVRGSYQQYLTPSALCSDPTCTFVAYLLTPVSRSHASFEVRYAF